MFACADLALGRASFMSLAWLKLDVVLGSIGKLAAASLLITTLGLTGCGDDPVKAGVAKGCTLNSDCNGGLVCSFGLCHQECEQTTDCPANQRCVKTDASNVCQLADESQCHFNTDCADPLVCAIDLQCRNQCNGKADCLEGQECADHVCAEPAEVADDGGLKGAVGAGGDGAGGNASTGGGTGGMTSGDAGDNAGGAPPVSCVAGEECVPDGMPCAVGTTVCTGDVKTCEMATDAEDGTACGTDQVCSAGACVDCKAGDTCSPEDGNVCLTGTLSCATGPSCDSSVNVKAGTSCGTDKVCSVGACVACVVDEACDPAGQACKNGKTTCNNGPACAPTTNKGAGSTCGTDQVCDSGGACKACVQDGACAPAGVGAECHIGKQDCATGPNCNDTFVGAVDGISCVGPSTYNFCTAGTCVACQNGNACVPTNPCHKGTLNCGTTPPTCNDSNANATDGLACGGNKSCISGACLTNDRVLTVTSGAVPDAAIDGPFTGVTVHLVDGNNANVQGAALTVAPSAGAYAIASAGTNASGNAQITGRVGRAIGTYKFTVSAPGATPIEFSVKAVATAAKNIFTLVNINHISGGATAPGAGTISKLYSSANAVAAASDGTLYVAAACAVYQLTPAGVLTRIAGQANANNDLCGSAGEGLGTSTQLYNVYALALDEANSFLYIVDYSNYRVRQLDLGTGNILTFAGDKTASTTAPYGDGGPADSAYMLPTNAAVAPNGDVYISDYNSNRIRKVDHNSGVITTVFTSVSCSAANPLSFSYCGGYGDACNMAWDKTGKMFISAQLCGGGQSSYRGVARVEADMSLTAVAGTTGAATPAEGGIATSAAFTYTPYIAFDKAGNLFLASYYDNRVHRVDAVTSKISTVAGTGNGAYSGEYVVGNTAEIYHPATLSFDGAGNLYFADSSNIAIRGIYGIGASVTPTATLATVSGTGQTVTRDAPFGALLVKLTDSANAAISGVNIQWTRVDKGSGLGATGAPALASKTSGAGTSAMTGRVGLTTGAYHFEARYSDIHGTAVAGSPQSITVTATDPAAGIVFPVVNYVHVSGSTGFPGPATFAKLTSYALGVAAASDGTMYVSDYCAVYKVTPAGEIALFAGGNGCAFGGDSGPATSAKLYGAYALALDEANGVLYIADYNNARIRMVTLATNVIETLAGGNATNTQPWGDGGLGTDANIGNPSSVSVDANGLIYIPDYGHNRIRVVDPVTGFISTWLAGGTPCVNGTVSFGSLSQFGNVVRFKANGDAYVSGNICQGTTTNQPLGIALRAKSNGAMTRIVGLNAGITTENADAIASALPDLSDFDIEANGNLVLAMYTNNRVRRIDMTTGKINTVIGDNTTGYAGAGDVSVDPGAYVAASSARLSGAWKLAVAPGGHLLIADENNQAIRMIW
jgi:hypothetical protein